MMRIAVLTSSRADYSVYSPLIKLLSIDADIYFELIAFGTHLSKNHGYTIEKIWEDGYNPILVEAMPEGDNPIDISSAMGIVIEKFAVIWDKYKFDLVFCLGDRFEMFAACASSVPFNVTLAHLHGGEKTLGAIDECFRHSITLMSKYHFTIHDLYKKRVIQILGHSNGVENFGALSIDNLKQLKLLSIEEFKEKYGIDLSIPTILITFHPETIAYERNEGYTEELINVFQTLNNYQLVITMPNADTKGNFIRERFIEFSQDRKHVNVVENFGTTGYLSCMKHSSMILGNSSSGFVEASFFPKYVINIGNRQQGRIITDNIVNCDINAKEILRVIDNFKNFNGNIQKEAYGGGNTAVQILNFVKERYV